MCETSMLNESRVEQAVATFREGYNCAQAVFVTYADLFGMDRETALKLASPFGGGMGRMRLVCGAVSGMFLVNGLANGCTDPGDRAKKTHTYEMVQQLAAAFKAENGSLICAELLAGLEKNDCRPEPSARDEAYYRKRPCAELVRCCARIVEEQLLQKK